jgi:hypothetical protein
LRILGICDFRLLGVFGGHLFLGLYDLWGGRIRRRIIELKHGVFKRYAFLPRWAIACFLGHICRPHGDVSVSFFLIVLALIFVRLQKCLVLLLRLFFD